MYSAKYVTALCTQVTGAAIQPMILDTDKLSTTARDKHSMVTLVLLCKSQPIAIMAAQAGQG